MRVQWMLICNEHIYDLQSAINTRAYIAWPRSVQVAAGDEVYIFLSYPTNAVMCRCLVTEEAIPEFPEDQTCFVRDSSFYKDQYMGLKVEEVFTGDMYTADALKQNGLATIQMDSRISEKLGDYLDSHHKKNPLSVIGWSVVGGVALFGFWAGIMMGKGIVPPILQSLGLYTGKASGAIPAAYTDPVPATEFSWDAQLVDGVYWVRADEGIAYQGVEGIRDMHVYDEDGIDNGYMSYDDFHIYLDSGKFVLSVTDSAGTREYDVISYELDDVCVQTEDGVLPIGETTHYFVMGYYANGGKEVHFDASFLGYHASIDSYDDTLIEIDESGQNIIAIAPGEVELSCKIDESPYDQSYSYRFEVCDVNSDYVDWSIAAWEESDYVRELTISVMPADGFEYISYDSSVNTAYLDYEWIDATYSDKGLPETFTFKVGNLNENEILAFDEMEIWGYIRKLNNDTGEGEELLGYCKYTIDSSDLR